VKHSLRTLVALAFACTVCTVHAGVPKDLPYPAAKPDALEIARQVYFVNHFYSVRNVSFERKGNHKITVMATRGKGKPLEISTLRRFLNNAYDKSQIKARDLVLFHSGNLIGSGMLVTTFTHEAKPPYYSTWLPALKRVRHFSEPAHDEAWSGSDLTYGDVYLREPRHETHELIGQQPFPDCLGSMELDERERSNRYLEQFPGPQCAHQGKEVYQLKSTTTFRDWWYDYRISYVDTHSFADYRTDYYKDEKLIKRIDRDWHVMQGVEDPRGVYWRYWYALSYGDNHETMVAVPPDLVKWNRDMDNDFWSVETMQHLRR